MNLLPSSLQNLVSELSKLPGVGERTAFRYAVNILKAGPRRAQDMQRVLSEVEAAISSCTKCHFWTDQNLCPICEDVQRSGQKLCVVRDAPDVLALEKFRRHSWRYHVLQGLLSPLGGVGPSQIRLDTLFARLDGVDELILALDPTVEGDATSFFIRDRVREKFPQMKISRTALGLPAGSSVEYLDPSTLESALNHRTHFE